MFLLKNALQSARMNDYWMIKPFNVLKNALQGRINERMQIKPTKEWITLPHKECSSVRMNVWMNDSTS